MSLKQIVSAPGRIRHSKGFGIHSPFAFEFVTKVLRDRRSAYYDYPAVDALSRQCGMKERVGRMLYRAAVRLHPEAIAPSCPQQLAGIICLAAPSASLIPFPPAATPAAPTPPQGCIVVISNIDDTPEAVAPHISRVLADGGSAIFVGLNKRAKLRTLWTLVNRPLQRGMTFTNNKIGIIVGLRHLPRQSFSLWL